MPAESENRCAKCQRANPPGMRFCGFCGSPLAAAYQEAGTGVQDSRIGETGTAPAEAAPSVPVTPAAPPSESRIAERPVSPPTSPSPALPPAASLKPEFRTPVPAANLTPIQREVERDKLMTQAGVQRARGQVTDARETLERALTLAEGAPARDVAAIYEQIGDLLLIEDDLERAGEAFQKAVATDPNRTTADKKYANIQIAISDREAEKRLGQQVLLSDDSIGDIIKSSSLSGHGGKRNAGLAMMLSIVVPGFGQFYNGQFIKGAILLATFAIGLLYLSLSPDREGLFGGLAATLALKHSKASPASALTIGVAVIGFAAWLYSVVDAPFYANKNVSADSDLPRSLEDKSGWEV